MPDSSTPTQPTDTPENERLKITAETVEGDTGIDLDAHLAQETDIKAIVAEAQELEEQAGNTVSNE